MITIKQIKAARALLDWTQADLAAQSGISFAAIANYEQGKGSPRRQTMLAIIKALENAGIEFTPDPGVRLRSEKYVLNKYEGYESILTLWRDIDLTLGNTGGEVLISGINETHWLSLYKDHLLESVRRKKSLGITSRILIAEGDNTVLIGPSPYRAVPKILVNQTPYFLYADKMAIVTWGPPQTVVIIQNLSIAQTFKNQFEYNWHVGRKLSRDEVIIVGKLYPP